MTTQTLETMLHKKIPAFTSAYLVNDGTIFYYYRFKPERLYVKWEGQEIDAALPGEVGHRSASGNAIFFISHSNIYKAVFTPSLGIAVLFVRHTFSFEHFYGNVATRERNGMRYVYRIDQVPEDGIIFKADSDLNLLKMELIGAHRGKAIYLSKEGSTCDPISIRELRDNVVSITMLVGDIKLYTDDAIPYIFFIRNSDLHTINTDTMEFHPIIQFNDAHNISTILNVHNRVITMHGQIGRDDYLLRARLPIRDWPHLFSFSSISCRTTRSLSADSQEITEYLKQIKTWFDSSVEELKLNLKHMTEEKEKIANSLRNIEWYNKALKSELCTKKVNEVEENKRRLEDYVVEKERRLEVEDKLHEVREENDMLKRRAKRNEDRIAELEINGCHQEFVSKFVNEFGIKKILGVGGFGIVFETTNSLDDCDYAVKRIPVDPRLDIVDKALREVRAMARLDHPGIVRYNSTWIENPPDLWQMDVDEDIQRRFEFPTIRAYHRSTMFIYIQMQLCSYSLEQWLSNSGNTNRDLSRQKKWFTQIVSAMTYIHSKGLIHRDLKPSNILFVEPDNLKLCDLGIATQFTFQNGCEVSSTRTDIGTALYKAPEQGIGEYDSKVDVFSLGLIIAEMSIIMNERERQEMFHLLRCGKPLKIPQNQQLGKETIEFIKWLTQWESEKRPRCSEILSHAFLA